jgi:hypothetical protein
MNIERSIQGGASISQSLDAVLSTNYYRSALSPNSSADRHAVRRFVMEPLLLAKELLNEKGLTCNVVGWIHPGDDHPHDPEKSKILYPGLPGDVIIQHSMVDYTNWTLTSDHPLIGASGVNLLLICRKRDWKKKIFLPGIVMGSK